MKIEKRFVQKNRFSRSGKLLEYVFAIVIHWVGRPGQSDVAVQMYFDRLAKQEGAFKRYKKQMELFEKGMLDIEPVDPMFRYASTQYIIDKDSITQVMPENEIAYHVGAPIYRANIGNIFWDEYLTNKPKTPNYVTIGIELCHEDWKGRFHQNTLKQAVELVADLMYRYKLDYNVNIMRHYDITGKYCPRWFVDNPDAWDKFRHRILKRLSELKRQEAKLKEF